MAMSEAPVLIVGAGPSGLLLSLHLAQRGVKSVVVERNFDTTKWPKMDITNCRSMELFRRLGITQILRDQGVPPGYSFDVLFSTGLSDGGELLCKWDLPSPNEWKERIKSKNDGGMPREPYQRISQALFEAQLKARIQAEPLIDLRFGHKFETYTAAEDTIISHVVDINTGMGHKIQSQYVVGCDGASSRVRQVLGSELIGDPTPGAMYLVHFKSRDLSALHRQGQFWHIFFLSGSVIIAQDEVDTWTVHIPIALDTDWKKLDPVESIYEALGGINTPFPIKVDEILVCSSWRPRTCIADRYTSDSLRVFLCGDAAHQNIPTGGYGMNTAVGDSYDLGWKLAAVVRGWGGNNLLKSYEIERKPVAERNIERSRVHHNVHQTYVGWVARAIECGNVSDLGCGGALRQRIIQHLVFHDGENKDHGIEMDYRYTDSPVILKDEPDDFEPQWTVRQYTPSTWPGARAPHVYLRGGKTSTFDLFGPFFTLFDFTPYGEWAAEFASTAKNLGIPLAVVPLPNEPHVRGIWQRNAVLIRPDDHVAWRSREDDGDLDVRRILRVVSGH